MTDAQLDQTETNLRSGFSDEGKAASPTDFSARHGGESGIGSEAAEKGDD